MSLKQNGTKMVMIALAALMLMSLPLAAAAQAANGITSPKDGATVKGTVSVTGYASDPNFSKWQLDLLPGGDPNAAIFLALGEKAGDVNYSLATAGLPDGEHALRLRVVKSDGNYDEYTNKFAIANGAATAARTAPGKDIVATAIGAGQFKTLVAAVKAAGLVSALQGKGPFTVFAPTDAAFAKLPKGTVESLLKDPKALSNILLYHVLSGEVKAAAVKDGLTAKTLQGSPVTFSIKDGKPMINDANIVATDIMASNGVVHVIDSVILPPANSNSAGAATTKPAPAKDIVATAIGAGQFNTLVAAVKAAGLAGALQGKGPFTVFAPTDAAFAKLPAGTVESLLKDPKALSNILLYHVLPGEVKAEAVKDGMTAKTLQGSPVTFKIVDGKPMIDNANIVSTDVMASNGVIHVIDAVILPPAAPAAAAGQMSNGLTAPKDSASVSGKVDIKGYAANPTFAKWQLDLLPGGDANKAVFLALGKNPGDLSYTLDTAGLPNGEHALRLRVVRNDGNYDEYVTKFVIANK